jgi:hypothetical protein
VEGGEGGRIVGGGRTGGGPRGGGGRGGGGEGKGVRQQILAFHLAVHTVK